VTARFCTRSAAASNTAAGAEVSSTRVGGHQQQAVGNGAQCPGQIAGGSRRGLVELDLTLECDSGGAFAACERRAQLRIVDHQSGQRGRRHRPGHQGFGSLLDHGAQILDAAAGPATVLRDRDPEQAQFAQAGKNGSPGIGLTLFDIADRSRRTRSSSPIAHQLARGELLVGNSGWHDPLLHYCANCPVPPQFPTEPASSPD
jgi:hypothetical protein